MSVTALPILTWQCWISFQTLINVFNPYSILTCQWTQASQKVSTINKFHFLAFCFRIYYRSIKRWQMGNTVTKWKWSNNMKYEILSSQCQSDPNWKHLALTGTKRVTVKYLLSTPINNNMVSKRVGEHENMTCHCIVPLYQLAPIWMILIKYTLWERLLTRYNHCLVICSNSTNLSHYNTMAMQQFLSLCPLVTCLKM